MMLRFVQSWFAAAVNPIGVDFGSDCLRLAQVDVHGGEHHLVAAASADVPQHVRGNPAARAQFFAETLKDLLAHGNFRGRRAVLALPASTMFIQHLRMPKLDDAETKKALQWEAAGKIPIDPGAALMRHVVAGEVYQDQEPKNEVILMAANRELVNQLLASASRAKLDVVGMNVEPKAVIDCFGHVYRRKTDTDVTTCYLDIGSAASRAVVAQGGRILFARVIPIGGDHFNRAVAESLKVSFEDAKILRIKLAHQQPAATPAAAPAAQGESRRRDLSQPPAAAAAAATAASAPAEAGGEENSFALLGAGMAAAAARTAAAPAREAAPRVIEQQAPAAAAAAPQGELAGQAALVEAACRRPLSRLVEELALCRRYHESVFPNKPVDRLIFLGGEARHRSLCQHVAREMGLAAQVGDPLVRMGRTTEVGVESGIDRRLPQPAWAVAIGLSMGPVEPEKA